MNFKANKINFNEVCRICLKSYKTLFYLFKTEASSMLNFCGFLEVVEGDEFPDKICERCNDMLVQSYKLKQLCLSSKSYLQSLVNINVEHDTTNSNLDCEPLQLHEEATSENKTADQMVSSDIRLECFFSKTPISEHNCCISNDDGHSILPSDESITIPSNEPITIIALPQSETDPDSVCDLDVDDKKNMTYACPHCSTQFSYIEDAVVHQSVHSDKGPICNVCNKLFCTMKVLKRHIKTHMITKSHICKLCKKGFSESAGLAKHEKLHHFRLPREKKYSCDQCGQRFTDPYYLNVHKRKHTGEKPFACKICQKSFYDPRSFKVHMDVHEGNKPYLCNHCGKSFVQSAHLRQHLLVHTAERPHTCKVCKKSFTQSTSLRRHQRLHSDMFYCYICSKRFSDQYNLNLHKREHTGEKPYACKICQKTFYDPRSYKVHMDVIEGKPYLCNHCGFLDKKQLCEHKERHKIENRTTDTKLEEKVT